MINLLRNKKIACRLLPMLIIGIQTAWSDSSLSAQTVTVDPFDGVTQTKANTKVSFGEGVVNPRVEFGYLSNLPKMSETDQKLLGNNSDPVALTIFDFEQRAGKDYFETPMSYKGTAKIITPEIVIKEDCVIEFEWAVDSEEGVGLFTFNDRYYAYSGTDYPVSISGLQGFEKVSIPVKAGRHEFSWIFNAGASNIGLGMARIKNIAFHETMNAEWTVLDIPADGVFSFSNLIPNRNICVRTFYEGGNGEKIYGPVALGKTLPIHVSEITSSSTQTTATVSSEFDAGDAKVKKGFIANQGNVLGQYIRYNVKMDGWDSFTDTSGEVNTVTFTTDRKVTVKLNVKVDGCTKMNYGQTTIPSKLSISEPFNTVVSSYYDSSTDLQAEFEAGTHSFTLVPDKQGDYSPYKATIHISFVAAEDHMLALKSQYLGREMQVECPGDLMCTFDHLNPESTICVYPYVELDYEPAYASDYNTFDYIITPKAVTTLNGEVMMPIVTEVTGTTATIDVGCNPGDAKIESLVIKYGKKDGAVSSHMIETPGGHQSVVLSRLIPGTEYSFSVVMRLEGCDKEVESEQCQFATLNVVPSLPELSNINTTSVEVSSALDDSGLELYDCGFEIRGEKYTYKYNNKTYTDYKYNEKVSLAQDALNYKFTGLKPGQSYEVRAFATAYGAETAYSEYVPFNTLAIEIAEPVVAFENGVVTVEVPYNAGDAELESIAFYKGDTSHSTDFKPYEFICRDNKIIASIDDYKINESVYVYATLEYAGVQYKSQQKTIQAYIFDWKANDENIKKGVTSVSFTQSFESFGDINALKWVVVDYTTKKEYDATVVFEGNVATGTAEGLIPNTYYELQTRYDDAVVDSHYFYTNHPSASFILDVNTTSVILKNVQVNYGTLGKDVYVSINGNSIPLVDNLAINDLEPATKYSVYVYSYLDNGAQLEYLMAENIKSFTTSQISWPINYTDEIYQNSAIVNNITHPKSNLNIIEEWGIRYYVYSTDHYIPFSGNEKSVVLTGLTPDHSFGYGYYYKTKSGIYHYLTCRNRTTSPIRFSESTAYNISDMSSILKTEVTCDTYSGAKCGFQWKGLHWKSDPVYDEARFDKDGNIVLSFPYGRLEPNCDYAYRAFVKLPLVDGGEIELTNISQSGPSHWCNFRTLTEYCHYDPEVYTYVNVSPESNSVTLCGYFYYGTEQILECGYDYWKLGSDNTSKRNSVSKIRVLTDESMVHTISLDDIVGDYAVRAFVRTESGEYYGDETYFNSYGESTVDTVGDERVSSIVEILRTNHGIRILGANNSDIAVFTPDGVVVRIMSSYAGEEISLNGGLYIIRIGERSFKIFI